MAEGNPFAVPKIGGGRGTPTKIGGRCTKVGYKQSRINGCSGRSLKRVSSLKELWGIDIMYQASFAS